jgi:glutathione S-transferase
MSLTFYRAPMSTASVTDRVIAELGVPHEKVTFDLKKGDSRRPEFLALNPNGRVPTVVHDGVAIFESSAITMYLGETFGVEKGLWPAAGPRRGDAMKWVAWSNVTFGEAIGRWMSNTKDWVPVEERNARVAERALGDVERCLGILDKELEGRPYLLGAEFSLVDAHVGSFIDWLGFSGFDVARWRRVADWVKRCNDRPAYHAVSAANAPPAKR